MSPPPAISSIADSCLQAKNAAVPLGQAYEADGSLFADSEVYNWTYKLDQSAPLLYTRDDIRAKAAEFDGKARVGKSALGKHLYREHVS